MGRIARVPRYSEICDLEEKLSDTREGIRVRTIAMNVVSIDWSVFIRIYLSLFNLSYIFFS